MKFEELDLTNAAKARAQTIEKYASLKAALMDKLTPAELAALAAQPGKQLAKQRIEPDPNPRQTRDETKINPGNLGIRALDPGKLAPPNPKRSSLEPAHGPRGFLNELPEDVQLGIIELIEELSYVDAAAKLTVTLGRRVTKSALERFDNRQKLIRLHQERETFAAHAKQLNTLETPDSEFTNALDRIVRCRLLEVAPQIGRFENLERLTRIVERLRRADQLREKSHRATAPIQPPPLLPLPLGEGRGEGPRQPQADPQIPRPVTCSQRSTAAT